MRILPPTAENIALAADALRNGRLVGMPTETVYGLAANALDEDAVRATFAAKGRPADNPLIVHLSSFSEVLRVAADFPPLAQRLARAFWPGPLTIVLPKRREVPDVTTGGLDTLAVRIPAHPVAQMLIAASGVPVSAPSANPFMGLSPTRAEHLDPSLHEHLEMVLDGGPCEVGLESTVVDASGETLRLLRPGKLTQEEIESALGVAVEVGGGKERRSPGMYRRHYAPRTEVRLVDALGDLPGIRLGDSGALGQIALPADPAGYGAGLYAALHELDRRGLTEILIESPPDTPEWTAIWDRLRRATESS